MIPEYIYASINAYARMSSAIKLNEAQIVARVNEIQVDFSHTFQCLDLAGFYGKYSGIFMLLARRLFSGTI